MNYKVLLVKVFSAEVGAKFFLGIISIFTIRVMSTFDFANYAFAISIHLFLVSIVSSVINIIYITMDTEKSKEFQSSFLTLQTLLLVVLASIFAPINYLFNGLYGWVLLLTLVHFLFLFCQSYFQKLLQFNKYYKMEYFRVSTFFIMFVTYVYYSGQNVSARDMFIIQILATIMPLSVILFKICEPNGIFDFSKLNSLIHLMLDRKKALLLLYFAVVSILLNVDFTLIRIFGTEYELAEYGAAFRYYAVLQVALISIQKIMLPLVTQESDHEKILDIFRQHKTISIRLLFLAPVIVLSAIYLIPIINNGKYEGASGIFLILALSSYISFSFSPYSNILIKERNYEVMVRVIVIAIMIHVFLVYYFLKILGVEGVAFSNLITYAIVNLAIYLKAKKLLNESNNKTVIQNHEKV